VSKRQPRLALPHGAWARPWEPADRAALVLGHRDVLVRHYASSIVEDVGRASAAIADWERAWSNGSGAAWAITAHGDSVVGSVRFGLVDEELGLASVGYWLNAQGRGHGWATAALDAATRTVFDRLGWHRVELSHALENERSCAVARRCGYVYEGIRRRAMRYAVDGRWSDEHLHARLDDDPFAGDGSEE
jgi:ribosomal-protein-alanine N-acetyltransferase